MKITRREALRSAGAAAGLALWGLGRGAAAASAEVHELKVISCQPELYHGWPTLARCQDGELLVCYSGGREEHVCPFGRVELIRSQDEGRTWSDAQVLCDMAIDDRDAGILQTRKGTLLATTFTSLAYVPGLEKAEKAGTWPAARLERWRKVHNALSADARKALLGCWMLRSTDGGQSWSEPYRVPLNSPHGPVELADGRLLYAGKQLWEPENRNGVAVSSDDGQSWQWLAEIPTREGDDHRRYHELHAVEAADGTLVCQIRNHNPTSANETLQCQSSDGGKSWSVPRAIGVWGLPSHLLRLKDGRLLMTYGHRRPPFGNQARVSADHGRTWSEPVIVSGDGDGGDLGYPSTAELADGTLLSVWYERLASSPRAVLRQARWTLG